MGVVKDITGLTQHDLYVQRKTLRRMTDEGYSVDGILKVIEEIEKEYGNEINFNVKEYVDGCLMKRIVYGLNNDALHVYFKLVEKDKYKIVKFYAERERLEIPVVFLTNLRVWLGFVCVLYNGEKKFVEFKALVNQLMDRQYDWLDAEEFYKLNPDYKP